MRRQCIQTGTEGLLAWSDSRFSLESSLTFLLCCYCVPLLPLQPNCKTDIVDNNGSKKIVVLADRPIAKDEEICYNYFFASENEKIHCNCGAINCAGRLN